MDQEQGPNNDRELCVRFKGESGERKKPRQKTHRQHHIDRDGRYRRKQSSAQQNPSKQRCGEEYSTGQSQRRLRQTEESDDRRCDVDVERTFEITERLKVRRHELMVFVVTGVSDQIGIVAGGRFIAIQSARDIGNTPAMDGNDDSEQEDDRCFPSEL